MAEQNIYKKNTFCNPISIPNYPRGVEAVSWEDCMGYTKEPKTDYRSLADPSVLYYDNKWYLYPSYGTSFVSEDFVTWKHYPTVPYNMGYSPTVIVWKDKFFMTSSNHGCYIANSPTGPFEYIGNFIMPDGTETRPIDSALFKDDDDRIYIYWHGETYSNKQKRNVYCTYGAELDRGNPRNFITEPVVIHEFNPDNEWERNGEHNQNVNMGWIEGQWMLKHNGRYYMIYSAPGTEYSSYCMGAYYSDEGPLSGFVCQKNNPILQRRTGIVCGAGHGCIEHGPNNTLWAFYTIVSRAAHPFERKIGMDLVKVDENGELYCKVTDTPQLGVSELLSKNDSTDTGLRDVTSCIRNGVFVTSHKEGRDAIYAFDESNLTWWQADDSDKNPELYVNLKDQYVCEASRIIWKNVGLDYDKGIVPMPYKYVIEGRKKAREGEWFTILDMSHNTVDYYVDYQTFHPAACGEIRLRILEIPSKMKTGIVSFTVFGR